MNIKKQWYQITYDDPLFLPGKSIKEMIECISQETEFEYVILNDINGFGKGEFVWELSQKEGEIIQLRKLLENYNDIGGLEWGDFFLFKKKPKIQLDLDNSSYSKLISYSDTTIRAIDGQYLYIYTPDQSIVKAIENKFKIESLKLDFLENLDYPF